jgi:hypothetical protein
VTGDRAIRWVTIVAVLAVAIFAAVISFDHAVAVVGSNGEHGALSRMYPLVIDGLIIAASMVLLDAARHRENAPVLAWLLLGAGIAVTLAANVTYGAQYGLADALWAAWPAAAFVGCYELLMLLVRASARRARATAPCAGPSGAALAPIPTDAQNAAEMALRATLAAGNALSGRQLETRFGLSRIEATKVRQRVLVESNGHASQDTEEPSITEGK